MEEITNEQIQELLYELDEYARDYNNYEYGLPLNPIYLEDLTNMDLIIIVRDFLNKISK